MPVFDRQMDGGRSVSANSKAPRTRRGNQSAQADIYWSGITPSGSAAYPVEFFAVGGGGGGGAGFNNGSTAANGGTGGGGGGSQTTALSRVAGTYTITVGGAGSAGGYPSPNGGVGGTGSVVDPANKTVCSAPGGGGGQSNANPATNGAGGVGTTWTGGTGAPSVGGTTNSWTGTAVTYSTSGAVHPSGAPTGNEGIGGTAGGGNPNPGTLGAPGSTFLRIRSNFASKVLSTTGSPTTFSSSGYTYYKWTTSGTVTLLP
jgi:hypothetical protein